MKIRRLLAQEQNLPRNIFAVQINHERSFFVVFRAKKSAKLDYWNHSSILSNYPAKSFLQHSHFIKCLWARVFDWLRSSLVNLHNCSSDIWVGLFFPFHLQWEDFERATTWLCSNPKRVPPFPSLFLRVIPFCVSLLNSPSIRSFPMSYNMIVS